MSATALFEPYLEVFVHILAEDARGTGLFRDLLLSFLLDFVLEFGRDLPVGRHQRFAIS